MSVTKIARININTLRANTRVDMFFDFLHRYDIDLSLVQEVPESFPLEHRGYTIHHNIGPDRRGTALVAKQHCHLTNVVRTPSGRAVAATFNGTRIINVYAPSGTAKRAERECFYNQELATLLDSANPNLILGGDFNCVMASADTTGAPCTSRALNEIVRGLQLTDA
jgi:exonuclease III